ncbi:MAG TPA: formate/nitrite transporter family protein [Frankiaceae bacterium]|nr:formate/nitrite transporter family protein [Frankiaceae bacterium]
MTSTPTASRLPEHGAGNDAGEGKGRSTARAAAEPSVAQHDTEETFDRLLSEGVQRVGRSWTGLTATGLLGGFDIGLGVLALLLVESYTHSTVLAGLAFAIGFLTLTISHSELFTEDFLVPVTAVAAGRVRFRALMRLWGMTLVTNLVGGWVIMGIVMVAFPALRSVAIEAASFYIHLGTTWIAFALAVLGGVAITLMTHMQHSTNSEGIRLVPAILMPFLLGVGKLNHAIVVSLLCFAALQSGAPFGYADWLGLLVLAIVGNIVGGVGIVTGLRLLQVLNKLLAARADNA